MKKLLIGSLVMAFVLSASGMAAAQVRSWNDLDWWAQSDAGPGPVKASSGSGYWWWPTMAGSDPSDDGLWGNRGVVYGMFTPTPPPPPPPKPTPPPASTPAPKVERSVPVLNNVLFGFDKSNISGSGNAEIAKVAEILNENTGDTLTVEGHTCNINRSGDPQYNVKLGQRRADAVRAALIKNGINVRRVSAKSLGESKPAVPNNSDENRRMNRRVVFVYSITD